jgi:hypothetical protein
MSTAITWAAPTASHVHRSNLLATETKGMLLLSPRGNAFGTVHTDGSEEAVGLTAMIAVLVVAVCAVGIFVVHRRVRRLGPCSTPIVMSQNRN